MTELRASLRSSSRGWRLAPGDAEPRRVFPTIVARIGQPCVLPDSRLAMVAVRDELDVISIATADATMQFDLSVMDEGDQYTFLTGCGYAP